jgi:hypothetical protein
MVGRQKSKKRSFFQLWGKATPVVAGGAKMCMLGSLKRPEFCPRRLHGSKSLKNHEKSSKVKKVEILSPLSSKTRKSQKLVFSKS